jgi:hypothetical protein
MTGLRTRELTLFRGSEGTESGRQLIEETVRIQSVWGVSRSETAIKIVTLQRSAER